MLFVQVLTLSPKIKQCNHEDRESEEGLSTDGVKRLQTIIAPYWNSCAPVRPLLGALSLLPTEVVQREKKPRQPREKMDRVRQHSDFQKLLNDVHFLFFFLHE